MWTDTAAKRVSEPKSKYQARRAHEQPPTGKHNERKLIIGHFYYWILFQSRYLEMSSAGVKIAQQRKRI
ncbi:hypothetical protein EYF80_052414 [Liparis tanakae]|uniref:Uncharacterized protein n=1 Tax=Liparis tanakae TaxID=230148 RepID=A0A4Z2F875_9TELE|nr:hypothetical protein EYF80_052414 [Liparis tanakae]